MKNLYNFTGPEITMKGTLKVSLILFFSMFLGYIHPIEDMENFVLIQRIFFWITLSYALFLTTCIFYCIIIFTGHKKITEEANKLTPFQALQDD